MASASSAAACHPRSSGTKSTGLIFAMALSMLVLILAAAAVSKAYMQRPLMKWHKTHSTTLEQFEDSCQPLEPRHPPPTSVHDLRIDDFRVVAALGDSITAAFGARGLEDPDASVPARATNENRGSSFSMGGDPDMLTLPNLLRAVRRKHGRGKCISNDCDEGDVVGASVGDHLAEICYGLWCLPFQYRPAHDRFNAAQTGATASNLLHEVTYLVNQMRRDANLDFEKDFKLLTLFIGHNDVCLGCTEKGWGEIFSEKTTHDRMLPRRDFLSPDAFEAHVRDVVEALRQQLPMLVVNAMMIMNVSRVWDVTHSNARCAMLRAGGLVFECACAFVGIGGFGSEASIDNMNAYSSEMRRRMDELAQTYNDRLERISADYRALKDPSFAMVVDPLLRDADLREWGLEALSDVDCFHPNLDAHAALAIGVWNNLQLPRGKKLTKLIPKKPNLFLSSSGSALICPRSDSRVPVD